MASFIAVQAAQLVLIILFEKVEYDTFSFYFSKVELMRWWAGEYRPIMSNVQEFMPIGFTKLQMLFYASPNGRNALNFIVAISGALILARHIPRLFFPFAFLTLVNNAFFMQYTGYKTDAPLAVLSVLLILTVSVPYFRFQISALCALALVILSIRWSGAPVIAVAVALYLPTAWRLLHDPDTQIVEDILIAGCISIVLFNYLELGSYLDAFAKTGSFTPTESLGVGALGFSFRNLFLGLAQYLLVSLVETFEPLWRTMLDVPALGGFLEAATLGAKDQVITSTGEMRQSISVADGAGLSAAAIALFRRPDAFVRNCAIAALTVTALILAAYPYQPFYANRYFLSAQVLSYVPLVYVAMTMWDRVLTRWPHTRQKQAASMAALSLAAAYVLISGYMLAVDHHRNLITINDVSGVETRQISEGRVPSPAWLVPIYRQTVTERTFRGWSGFQAVYEAMRRTITAADELQIVTDTRAPDADYSFPFLRERFVANTVITDTRSGDFTPRMSNLLCFSTSACATVARSGGYRKIADQGPSIALWRRN